MFLVCYGQVIMNILIGINRKNDNKFKNNKIKEKVWREAVDGGKRKDKWDGNGKEKEWKKKKEKENWEDRELNKLLFCLE